MRGWRYVPIEGKLEYSEEIMKKYELLHDPPLYGRLFFKKISSGKILFDINRSIIGISN